MKLYQPFHDVHVYTVEIRVLGSAPSDTTLHFSKDTIERNNYN